MLHRHPYQIIGTVLRASLAGMIGTVGVAGGAFYARARRALPQTQGRIRMDGPRAPIEILRDRWGVPHIYAANNDDLFWAQGYVHATERLWQMDFHRRIGLGRLAELLGPQALPVDRFVHTLGLPPAAAADVTALAPEVLDVVEHYTAGVNAAIERMGKHRTPIEYALLRCTPEPWRPVDGMAWGKVIALAMAGNWEAEIVRAQMIARLGAERAAALEPHYPAEHHHTLVELGALLGELAREAARAAAPTLGFGGDDHSRPGSNAWAVSGARSATGAPLLAADPHLSLGTPALWFENHLHGGEYHVTGASFVGVPGVLIGHNDHIAWGITNAGIDVQDLYIERLNAAQERYETPTGWQPLQIDQIALGVRGAAQPTIHTVRRSRHGPLLATLDPAADTLHLRDGLIAVHPRDVLPPASAQDGATYGLALRWTAHDAGASVGSILALNRARTWDGFRAALADWTEPAQNVVYAGRDGNIGYQLAGRVPKRPNGPSLTPAPGWTDDHEWAGYVPFAELPYGSNPAAGYVATANNCIVAPERYPYHLSQEWMNGYRAERISRVLQATPHATLDDFERLQLDMYSLPGEHLRRIVTERVSAADAVSHTALQAFLAWNGTLDADSVGGAIYTALIRALQHEAFAELGPLLPTYLGTSLTPLFAANAVTLGRSTPLLLAALEDDDRLPFGGQRNAATVVQTAWDTAVGELRARLGDDVAAWRWGRLHRVMMPHTLATVPLLGRLWSIGPLALGGDTDTVCQLGYHPSNGWSGEAFGPAYRQIIDVGNWDASRSVLSTGQSGHPASHHYRDQVGLWQRGATHPQLWSREQVDQAQVARLMIEPKDAA